MVSLQASLQNLNIFIKFEYLGIPTLVDFIGQPIIVNSLPRKFEATFTS